MVPEGGVLVDVVLPLSANSPGLQLGVSVEMFEDLPGNVGYMPLSNDEREFLFAIQSVHFLLQGRLKCRITQAVKSFIDH